MDLLILGILMLGLAFVGALLDRAREINERLRFRDREPQSPAD